MEAFTARLSQGRAAAGIAQRGAPDGEQHYRSQRGQVGGHGEQEGKIGEQCHHGIHRLAGRKLVEPCQCRRGAGDDG